MSHGRGHLYRAVLEGSALGVRHMLEVMAEGGQVPERLVAVGGGTTGLLWPRIVSDVTGVSQELPDETIGASYGDAWLAGVAAGLIDAASDWSRIGSSIEPDPATRETYDELYGSFRKLYPATMEVVHELVARSRES